MQYDNISTLNFPAGSIKAALTYNGILGTQFEYGYVGNLEKLIEGMKPYQIDSFLGSTLHVVELSKPLTVFRAGPPGRFWCSSVPLSPLQQSLDLAMSPYIYTDYAMKQVPNWMPVNRGVLVYEIPANTAFAYGMAAPQFGWPGQTNQVYLPSFDTKKIRSFSWEQFEQKTVQEWAKQKISPSLNRLEYDLSSISWRPAVSEGIKVPWYQRPNYKLIGRTVAKVSVPPLFAWDIYNRFQHENVTHSNYSSLAKASAVATEVTVDLGSFLILAAASSGGVAALTLLSLNFISEKSHEIRDLPPEKFKEDRDFLANLIHCLELSSYAGNYLLEDFDKGGQVSRDFNYQAASASKAFRQPFEALYDGKKKMISLARDNVEAINGSVDKEKNIPSSPKESLFSENFDKNQGLSDIFKSVDYKATHLQTAPILTIDILPLRLNSRDISLIKTENSLVFNSRANTQAMNLNAMDYLPEKIQTSSSVIELPLDRAATYASKKSLPLLHSVSPKTAFKKPIVSDIRLGPAGGGIGIIATLAGSGSVSFSVNSGGALIFLSVDFGPGFFSALGAGTGIGIVIAGAVLAAQFFYKKGTKRIEKKIKSSFKYSQIDSQAISKALIDFSHQLEPESNTNLSELIYQGLNLKKNLTDKIGLEQKWAQYARRKKRFSAGVAHNDMAMSYQFRLNSVITVNASLEHSKIQEDFITENKHKNPQEIIELAHTLGNKEFYTEQDVAKIKGLRQLIVNNALKLSGEGCFLEAQTLLSQTALLQYYLPGNMPGIRLGEAFGHLDGPTQKDIEYVNTQLIALERIIGSGKNPTESLNKLSVEISEIISGWEHREAKRGHKKRSSQYVTKEQWKARIDILRELVKTLNHKMVEFSHGNNPSDLNLSNLSLRLQQLSGYTEKTPEFWLSEFSQLTQGTQVISDEELLLFKAISSHYLMKAIVGLASQGQFEEAKTIIQKLAVNVPEYQTLSEQYTQKMDELTPFLEEKAEFWMARIETLQGRVNHEGNDAEKLETVIAEQFILNDVFSKAVQGEFVQAKILLEKFKIVMPEKESLATGLISKVDNLQLHYQDVDYCLLLLKNSHENPAEPCEVIHLFEQTMLSNVILSNILSHIMAGEFVKANSRCEDYLQAAPDKSGKIGIFRDCIQELSNFQDKDNQTLLEHLGIINNQSGLKDEIISANLENWILQNIFNSVSAGELNKAKTDLLELSRHKPQQKELCSRLAGIIEHAKNNADQDEFFWQKTFEYYSNALDTHTENDRHDTTVNNMGKTVSVRSILNLAGKRSASGFYREAAEMIKRLNHCDASLNLKHLEEDFYFAYHGQLIGIFSKPGQAMLTSYIQGSDPSLFRTSMQGVISLLNTVQTVVPNAVPLTLQLAQARFINGNMSVVNRNLSSVYVQLSKDLNPWDPQFNPFNKATHFNGAMIYSQLALKAVQHLPLAMLVPEKNLKWIETFRNNSVYYGHLATRVVSSTHTISQIIADNPLKNGFFSNANKATILANTANTGIDLGYWTYHKYLASKGQSIEKSSHYITQNTLGNLVEGLGMMAFVSKITRNKWLTLSAALVTGGNVLYHFFSRSAHSDAAQKALMAALSNINYHQKKEDEGLEYQAESFRSIESILRNDFNGFAYDNAQPEVANMARIVYFSQSIKACFEAKKYDELLHLTNPCEIGNTWVINPVFQLPPHLIWQSLIGHRLLTFAQNLDLLLLFRKEYQTYSSLIDASAKKQKKEYESNINTIKMSLKQILSYAFQQFILAADQEEKAEKKILYLSYLTKSYYFYPVWHKVLLNDELKFWTAYLYFTLGKKQECELFLNHIIDFPALIKSKKQVDFTEHALMMLEEINAKSHLDLLTEVERDQFAINDAMISAHFFKLLGKKEYSSAQYLLNNTNDFEGKTTAYAAFLFEISNRTQILKTLKKLNKETHQDLAYWLLLLEVLSTCISCIPLARNQTVIQSEAMLYGLIKICTDYIQSFPIPHELSVEINIKKEYALNHIRKLILKNTSSSMVNEKLDYLLEKGHKCLRGEEKFSLTAELQKILVSLSYSFVDEKIKYSYLAMNQISIENLQKNIRIFTTGSQNELNIANQIIKNVSFETIDVVQNKSGKYRQLIKLKIPIVEVVDVAYVGENMFFKRLDSKKSQNPAPINMALPHFP